VRVTGVDGRADVGQRLVAEGVLVATIVQSSSGRPAIDWTVRCLQGRDIAQEVILPVAAFPELSPRIRLSA
jgi:hypothetical protein